MAIKNQGILNCSFLSVKNRKKCSDFLDNQQYLLFMYLFMWESNIGLDVTSFWRYMGTLIGAWLLYFVSEMFIYLKNANEHTNKIVIIAVILCMFLIIPLYDIRKSFIPLWGNVISTGREQRNNYLDSEQFAGMLNWKEDKVYIVSQFAERSTTNYLDYWITRYNIAPVKTNEFPSYSFNDTGNDRNRSYVDMTSEEWENILIEDAYSFVYIYAIDEGFIEEFGGLFEDNIVDQGLFRVSRLDGSVKLIRVYR